MISTMRNRVLGPGAQVTPEQLEAALRTALPPDIQSSSNTPTGQDTSAQWKTDFLNLGPTVSTRELADYWGAPEKLATYNLPRLDTPNDVASLLDLSLEQLRRLVYDAGSSRHSHYYSFTIPKKRSGQRLISAPHKYLKEVQGKLKIEILDRLPTSRFAHGFVKSRSPLSNALIHPNQGAVINLDLKDFFPSINVNRVAAVFSSFGYSPAISNILALLCTTRSYTTKIVDGARPMYFFTGERTIPQGAPTSPGLANQVARRMDARLGGYATKIGFLYSRYADDITFSGPRRSTDALKRVLECMINIVRECGFTEHAEKQHIGTCGGRQQVTGYNVNHTSPTVSKEYRRDVRHRLHKAERSSLQEQHEYEVEHMDASPIFQKWILGLFGQISHISTAHPEEGSRRRSQLKDLLVRDSPKRETESGD